MKVQTKPLHRSTDLNSFRPLLKLYLEWVTLEINLKILFQFDNGRFRN